MFTSTSIYFVGTKGTESTFQKGINDYTSKKGQFACLTFTSRIFERGHLLLTILI